MIDNGISSAAGLKTLNLGVSLRDRIIGMDMPGRASSYYICIVLVLTERNGDNRVPHSDQCYPHSDQCSPPTLTSQLLHSVSI